MTALLTKSPAILEAFDAYRWVKNLGQSLDLYCPSPPDMLIGAVIAIEQGINAYQQERLEEDERKRKKGGKK